MKKVVVGFIAAFCLIVMQAAPVVAFATVQKGWQQAGWLNDFEAAVKKARSVGRPTLVYFDALWCSWCQQYKRDVLDKPAVKSMLKKLYIPVVVDFDARPDLFNRFGGRGLPFTVILSPDGAVINRFVGILAEEDFLDMLEENKKRFKPQFVRLPAIFDPIHVRGLDRDGHRRFRKAFLEHIDSLYSSELGTLIGQYETGATLKRPSPRTWLYLMKHGLWPARVKKAIAAEQSRLLDRQDGGFFNFLDPGRAEDDYLESAKLLEANAWLTAWFAMASRNIKSAMIGADMGWFYLRDVLWDKKYGGFWQAQVADNNYYELPIPGRVKRLPPPVDRIKRADTNAQAAIALYRAGRDRNNAEMKRYAERTLGFILDHLVEGENLFHVRKDAGGSVAALPQDWFWVLLAGQEINSGSRERERKMKEIAKQAGAWVQQQMDGKPQPILSAELAGLIAQSSCGQTAYSQMPKTTCTWALRQLRIEPETPPDEIVPGLLAWENFLAPRAPDNQDSDNLPVTPPQKKLPVTVT